MPSPWVQGIEDKVKVFDTIEDALGSSETMVAFEKYRIGGKTFISCDSVATMLDKFALDPDFAWDFGKIAERVRGFSEPKETYEEMVTRLARESFYTSTGGARGW